MPLLQLKNVRSNFRFAILALSYQSSANKVITLPTAPRAARSIEIDQSRIPDSGPFTAYVGNLPYDANQYMLEEFFKDIEVIFHFK